MLNGLIGNQALHGAFATTTGFQYMLPLGGGGLTRPFGASNTWLACCWGTMSETFAKLSDSVYWQSADGDTLFVNLFVASTATWRGGAVVAQAADFPYAAKATTTRKVGAAKKAGAAKAKKGE